MAIGINVGNSQNTAEVGFWFKFEKNRGFITKPLQKVLIRKSNRAFTWMIWPPPPPFLPLALLTLLWPSGACLSCVLKVWSRTIFYKRPWKTSSFQMKLKQNWWKWVNWGIYFTSPKIMGKGGRLYISSVLRVLKSSFLFPSIVISRGIG